MRQVRTISRKDFILNVEATSDATGHYLTGFVDGEGSFNISFRLRPTVHRAWKVSLCFNVSQREPSVLKLLQLALGCGTMRQRQDGVWYFEVNSLGAIRAAVIPFFERFPFLSEKKQRDFRKFCELTLLMEGGHHLTREGVEQILEIRKEMNDGGKRRHGDAEILSIYRREESSETVRRTSSVTPLTKMRQSELHGDMQSGYRIPPSDLSDRIATE